MKITERTRKILWAKSGNRCLLCRIELIQEIENEAKNLVIGMECHIISSKKNGPRGMEKYDGDFNSYENLMLLCANDHKRVDDLTEIYTAEKLKLFKTIHENWVKTTLEKDAVAFTNEAQNIKSLPKINSGKKVFEIVRDAHVFDFNNDELLTEEEANLIGSLFEDLRDYGDILSDIGYEGIARYEVQLNKEIDKLNQIGFLLFGIRREVKFRNTSDKDLGLLETASIVAVRKDNPYIIGDFLIAKFPPTSKLHF